MAHYPKSTARGCYITEGEFVWMCNVMQAHDLVSTMSTYAYISHTSSNIIEHVHMPCSQQTHALMILLGFCRHCLDGISAALPTPLCGC